MTQGSAIADGRRNEKRNRSEISCVISARASVTYDWVFEGFSCERISYCGCVVVEEEVELRS